MKTASFFSALAIAFVLCFYNTGSWAQASDNSTLKNYNSLFGAQNWAFEENMGQLSDPSGANISDIKFFGKSAGVQVYCKTGGLSFVFIKKTVKIALQDKNLGLVSKFPQINTSAIVAARMDMEFENANPNVKIISEDKAEHSLNYFKANATIKGVSAWKKLTYVNLYPNIDMVLLTKGQGLEYKFVVHPGGKASDIKLIRKGMDKMEMLEDGGIRCSSAFGQITEAKPISYTGQKGIKSSFVTNGNNTVSFSTGSYDHKQDLVIDPDLTWATYYGGTENDFGIGLTTDVSGNVYITGSTLSTAGIATKGASQTALGGSHAREDAFVAKFSSAGALLWASYFGGDSMESGVSVAMDSKGNVFVGGTTQSISGIATKGAYQTSLGGTTIANDAFLAKFNGSGVLQWATYYGGEGNEALTGVAVDGSNNICISGYTSASAKGIATSGAFQTSSNGSYDAFLAKFSNSGALLWGTYFGGSSTDAAYSVAVDGSKNIYMSGLTYSASIATTGAFKTNVNTINGNAFLTKFDSNGVQKWGTYFGGNGGDNSFGVTTNGKSDVYITGNTGSPSGIATTGAYQTSLNTQNYSAFIADFSMAGALKWATYYGGEYVDAGLAIALDKPGNIFITGYTISTTGIASSGAYQKSLANPSAKVPDAYLAKFTNSGSFRYGTYYGGAGVEEAIAIAVDNADNIYLTGVTTSDSGIATSGSFQTALAGGYDAFLTKFQICDLKAAAAGTKTVCVNDNGYYKASDNPNTAYSWTATGGTIVSGAGTDSIVVRWTSTTGKGSVMVKEVTITGCRDSVIIPVTVNALPIAGITGKLFPCTGVKTAYHTFSSTGITYNWTVTGGIAKSATTADSIIVQWPNNPGKGTLLVKEKNTAGCVSSDSTEVVINAFPNAKYTVTDVGKGSYIFKSADSTNPATGYSWFFQGGPTITGYHVSHVYAHAGTYHVIFTVTNAAGCISLKDSVLSIIHAGIDKQSGTGFGLNIYPNPFEGTTHILFSIPVPGRVQITVTDMLGRDIATLADKTMEAGNHETVLNDKITHLGPGTYFVKISANGQSTTQKIVKMRD
jgi:hypothetical protein